MKIQHNRIRSRLRNTFLPAFSAIAAAIALLCPATAQTYIYNQAAVGTGVNPSAIVPADFNGDGRPDLAVTNQNDNSVSVVLSREDGSFAPKVDYKVGAAPVAAAS